MPIGITGIATQIKNLISPVTGIGQVFTYLRWAGTDKDFQTFAVTGGAVNLWQITRKSSAERWLTTGEFNRAHVFHLYGAYGLKDSTGTEETFQVLVDRVCGRFRSDTARTLNDTVESLAPAFGELSAQSEAGGAEGGLQVVSIEHREFHGILVHWAECHVGVQELPQLFP